MDAPRRLRLLTVFAALGTVVVLVLLGLVVRPWPVVTCSQDDCEPPPIVLPEAIRFGGDDPRVFILLWIDLESPTSRQIFQHVTRAVAAGGRDVAAELRLLHLPVTPCRPRDPSLGCLGARLVECADGEMAGAGMHVAGALLDLQWKAAGERTAAAVMPAVTRLGLDAEALLRCADGSATVDARLTAHATLAARYGLTAAPGGLVIDAADPRRSSGFGAWLTEGALRTIVDCLVQRRCEEAA